MSRHILVPVDGSDHSLRAFTFALEHHKGDRITALHVTDPTVGEYNPDTPGGADRKQSDVVRERTDEEFERLGSADTEFELEIIEGKARETILSYADQQDVDQIVMGPRGLSGVRRLLLGSVTDAIVRRSKVPVNVIPNPEASTDHEE